MNLFFRSEFNNLETYLNVYSMTYTQLYIVWTPIIIFIIILRIFSTLQKLSILIKLLNIFPHVVHIPYSKH